MPVLSPTARVFVAGGTGMAGSAIVSALLTRRPHGTIRASRRNAPPAIQDPRVEYVAVDLAEQAALTAALEGCDAAVLAASESGGIRMLTETPWQQVTPNLRIATAWFEALKAAGVGRTVCVGSATCYQPFDGLIREDQLDWNLDPSPEAFGIGWVMRSQEKLCEFWQRVAGLDLVRVRAANIYGPRARFDPARSNVIPALVRKVADAPDRLDVWGSPEVTRDVVFAGDFGEAVVRLLEAPDASGRVFNVGSGRGVRIGDVVATLLRVAGRPDLPVAWGASGPRSSPSRILDVSRLAQQLQWTPATSLEDGLRATLAWWQAHRATWQR